MALDEPKDGDAITETDGIKIVIDQMSLRYLQGAEIDYRDGIMGGGFAIQSASPHGGACGI